jgi:hypothetical protein
MKYTPSSRSKLFRISAATSSFRSPFRKVISGMSSARANCSRLSTNRAVIGSISADDANASPRCRRKNPTTPSTICNFGTYPFRYRRSMPSISRTTCSPRMSLTEGAALMAGSGGHIRKDRRLTAQIYGNCASPSLLIVPPGPFRFWAPLHLVGLRRSLASTSMSTP